MIKSFLGSNLTEQNYRMEIQSIEEPQLSRKGKAPVRHEFGEEDTHHFPETPKDHYKRIYFNSIDTVTQVSDVTLSWPKW